MTVEKSLDYNLAYYGLTQARVNQLAIDQERYLFVEFAYDSENVKMLENIYKKKERTKKDEIVFKIEFTTILSGNIYLCKKQFYREELYDYVTIVLNKEFYDFYLDNIHNPKYRNIDLRIVWYFIALDRSIDIYIKHVRDSKYVFSYKKMCEAYDHPVKEQYPIKVCCKNIGMIKNENGIYLCPVHFFKNG